ncbi:MAG: hypothetical protein PHY55_04220 [Bacteroidales bacterium]|nr:hypothetical protein [Bacteroidales bacterium]
MEKDLKTILEEINKTIKKNMAYHEQFLIFMEEQKIQIDKVNKTLNEINKKLEEKTDKNNNNNIYSVM